MSTLNRYILPSILSWKKIYPFHVLQFDREQVTIGLETNRPGGLYRPLFSAGADHRKAVNTQ